MPFHCSTEVNFFHMILSHLFLSPLSQPKASIDVWHLGKSVPLYADSTDPPLSLVTLEF